MTIEVAEIVFELPDNWQFTLPSTQVTGVLLGFPEPRDFELPTTDPDC